ncbi:unnamed protein product [Litomosoides sigmodontis]|uniref:Uncharacterized protein n=1 Tax=Litomosoides sigmodontis TaxID=42156 RepID=A0A3P6U2D9_LITSI|nr:unnamed protein product [Litomosoides sigmodontis]
MAEPYFQHANVAETPFTTKFPIGVAAAQRLRMAVVCSAVLWRYVDDRLSRLVFFWLHFGVHLQASSQVAFLVSDIDF